MDKILSLWENPEFYWINQIAYISIGSLVCWLIWRVLSRKFAGFADKTRISWDDAFIHAIRLPVSTTIWCLPGLFSLEILFEHYFNIDAYWIREFKVIISISVVVWAIYRMVGGIEKQTLKRGVHDVTTVQAISKVVKFTVVLMGAIIVMQTIGLSLSGLMAFGGVGGLTVGIAAKDLLSNFFGGLMIYFDRPFKIGDWVRSPDRQIEGTVEHIGWRMTIIRTFDKRPLYIPNSVFTNIVVENPSRMTNRRIYETIGLRYDDIAKVRPIIESIKNMLQAHPDIDEQQTLIVNFNAFGDSSLDFFVYTFTKTTNWIEFHEVKQNVMLKIADIVQQHSADIAYPTQTVKVDIENLAANNGEPSPLS